MSNTGYVLGVIAAMGLITFALRALPFGAAAWLRQHAFVERLGRLLPLAIMAVLTLHAAAGAALHNPRGPWHEMLAVAIVVLLQWRLRHPLLSMAAGTALYVALRNGAPGF